MGYAINPEAIFDFENRVTHTDSYTFNKNSYTQSRSYAPSRRYAAAKSASTGVTSSSSRSKASAKKSSGKRVKSQRSTYKVRRGDSLGKIAERNGTNVAQIKKLNGIKGNNVKSGKVLRVK